jgi:PAS domain-containing protein
LSGQGRAMSTSKAIQIILARQLASCVAMPILLVDAEGTLVFYNEPAEVILNKRFDETGEIPADEWNELVTVVDEDRNPILPEVRPMRAALLQRRPISRTIWMRSGDSQWRHLQVTAFPLVGEGSHLLGVMNIFWEI